MCLHMQVIFLSEQIWAVEEENEILSSSLCLEMKKKYLLPLSQEKISKSPVSPVKEGFEDLLLHIIGRQPPTRLLMVSTIKLLLPSLCPERARSSAANGLSIIRKLLETTTTYITKPLRYASRHFSYQRLFALEAL